MRHEVFHAIHKQPPNTFEQSEYQAALFEHFRELDSRVYTRHKILGKAFQLLPVPTAPAAAPSASAVSSRRSSDAGSVVQVAPVRPQLGKVGKWKVLENAASRVLTRGKSETIPAPDGSGTMVSVPRLEAHAMELLMVAQRAHELESVAEEAKTYRRHLKRMYALEVARQRLILNKSTLAEPVLRPNKAVEATDKRVTMGQGEYPPQVFEAVSTELQAARKAANHQISVRTVMDAERHRQGVMTLRAASGALWAFQSGRKHSVASELKKQPPLPAGMRAIDAESASHIELPGRRGMRANLLALVAAASASGIHAERAAVGQEGNNGAAAAAGGGSGASVPDTPVTPSPSSPMKRGFEPDSPKSPSPNQRASSARSSFGAGGGHGVITPSFAKRASHVRLELPEPPKPGTYKTAAEAISKVKLFPSARTEADLGSLSRGAAGATPFKAVQLHADGRCNHNAPIIVVDASAPKAPHALRGDPPPSAKGDPEKPEPTRFLGLLRRSMHLWPRQALVPAPEDLTGAKGIDGHVPHSLEMVDTDGKRAIVEAAAEKIDKLVSNAPDGLYADAITEKRAPIRRV